MGVIFFLMCEGEGIVDRGEGIVKNILFLNCALTARVSKSVRTADCVHRDR